MKIPNMGAQNINLGDIDRQLRTMRSKASAGETQSTENTSEFYQLLKDGVKSINSSIKESDKASLDMAAGKPVNLHETMLKVTQAELAFNLAVQMRNKVVEAYQEVMRMQV